MQRLIALLLPMIISTSCLLCGHLENGKHKPADYVEMSDKIVSEVINKLKKRYNVKVAGIGSGMIDRVNKIGVTFQINRVLPLEKIREMLIDMMEEFLAAFNTNEQIRPFLKNYPFTDKEIHVTLFLKDQNSKDLYEPDIRIAAAGGNSGEVWYEVKLKGSRYEYKIVKEETYKEALEIVRGKKE